MRPTLLLCFLKFRNRVVIHGFASARTIELSLRSCAICFPGKLLCPLKWIAAILSILYTVAAGAQQTHEQTDTSKNGER